MADPEKKEKEYGSVYAVSGPGEIVCHSVFMGP